MGPRVKSPDAAPWRPCVQGQAPPPVPDCHAILGVLDAGAFTIAIAADGRDKGLLSGSDE